MYQVRLVAAVLLRLLLAFAAVLGAVHLVRGVFVPGLQSLFHPGDSVTSLLRRIGILLFAVLAYWAYVRLVEKRKAVELRPAPLAMVVGAMSGSVMMAMSMLLLFAIGIYHFTPNLDMRGGLPGVLGLIVVAAFLEELTYRCILFRLLESAWGTMPAMCVQALIFAFAHAGNLEGRETLQGLATMIVAVTLTGTLWTLVFVHTRNLWAATANHAAWNFTIILSGLPLSGIEEWRGMAPWVGEYGGPAWLSGGIFGPETSIVTIVLLALSVVALLYWARKKKRLISGKKPGVDAPPPPLPQAHHA